MATAVDLWPSSETTMLSRVWDAAKRKADPSFSATNPHVDYQERPEDWIVEKLGIRRETLRWALNEGYEQHEWDGTEEPLVAIMEAMARGDRKIGVESGTGTGKSFLAACLILWFLACWRNARVFTFAPKEDQLELYIWAEISELWPRFKRLFPEAVCNHLEILVEPGNKLWGAWGFPVGIRAGETVSSKARGMHSEHLLIVSEEMQGQAPQVIAANEATCTSPHNIRLGIGNPSFPADELHKFCTQPGTTHIRISGEDHPNVVTGREIVPGAQSRTQVQAMFNAHGRESRDYQISIRGLCPDGGGPALPELSHRHLVPDLKALGVPPLDSELVTVFGWLDWGHAHPWSFGKYICWVDPRTRRQRVVKLETITGHRMRTDRIAKAIKDEFPDIENWDYVGAGSDIKQRHVGRNPSHIVVRTIQEQLMDAGLYIGAFVDDGPYTLKDRLSNLRQWTSWQGTGPLDPTTGRNKDGEPDLLFLDTPGNRACVDQMMEITTDPKKPENPMRRDANPETGRNGDDMFAETMMALASRPYAEEPEEDDAEFHHNTGFVGKAGMRKRRSRTREDEEQEGFVYAGLGTDDEDDEEEDRDWWRGL